MRDGWVGPALRDLYWRQRLTEVERVGNRECGRILAWLALKAAVLVSQG